MVVEATCSRALLRGAALFGSALVPFGALRILNPMRSQNPALVAGLHDSFRVLAVFRELFDAPLPTDAPQCVPVALAFGLLRPPPAVHGRDDVTLRLYSWCTDQCPCQCIWMLYQLYPDCLYQLAR